MNSKERLVTALNHQQPDRIPYDLGATFTSGIHANAYHKLREFLELPQPLEDRFLCLDEQIVFIDEDIKQRLMIDTEPVLPGNPSTWNLLIEDKTDHSWYRNEWQMGLKMPKDGGFYYDVVDNPLAEAGIDDLKYFPWPDPYDSTRYATLEQDVQQAAETGRAVIMNSISAGILEMSAWLIGYQRLFTGLLLEPEFLTALFDKILDIKLAYWETVLQRVGDKIDVVIEADDLAEQRQLLISPRTYRKLVKPYHKQLYETIHSRTGAKIFHHSCGSVYALIPDLIEIGVDILNPVQVNAANMDSAKLKAEFGRDIVFWGGAVDPQGTLNSGSPNQVYTETSRNIESLAKDGGFVFAAVHNIQPNIPPQNIMAMWQALQD